MSNNRMLLIIPIAVVIVSITALISNYQKHEPFDNPIMLAMTLEKCPAARRWLLENSAAQPLTEIGFGDLNDWINAREADESRLYLSSGRAIQCRALKDFRSPS